MRRFLLVLALAASSTLVTGCVLHHRSMHPHGMPPGQAKKLGQAGKFGHFKAKPLGHVHVNSTAVKIKLPK